MLRGSQPRFFNLERVLPTALVLGVGISCFIALIAMNGALGWTIGPIVLVAALWLIAVSPIRNTFCVLLFLSLSTDRTGDASGLWQSPFINIGGLFSFNMSKILGIEALKLSGIALTVILMLVTRLHRMFMGRKVDTDGAIVPAPPLNWALGVSFFTLVSLVVWGLVNGGDGEMVKVQTQVFLPLLGMAFVLGPSFRGSRDYRTLAKVVLVAACCKSVMALWARHVLPEAIPDTYGVMREVEYATSHGDSLLFACACLILIVPMFFNAIRRHLMWLVLIGPLIVAGMLANDRRLAWVELAIGLALLVLMNPGNWITRRMFELAKWGAPILVLYVGVGWFSASRVFQPVKFARSIVVATRSDGTIDRSTLFRDVENFNLIYTFQASPIIGTGFGHRFVAAAVNDDLSGFKEYPFLPHNSLLGLMAFCGGLGVVGLLMPLVVALFCAARAEFMNPTPDQAMAAAVAIGNICAYLMHLWGDIGFTEPTSIFTVGASLAIAGQVAVSTGAWRVGRAARPPLGTHR